MFPVASTNSPAAAVAASPEKEALTVEGNSEEEEDEGERDVIRQERIDEVGLATVSPLANPTIWFLGNSLHPGIFRSSVCPDLSLLVLPTPVWTSLPAMEAPCSAQPALVLLPPKSFRSVLPLPLEPEPPACSPMPTHTTLDVG